MPRTAIAQIVKLIGQELESGAGPSEQALATGADQAGGQYRGEGLFRGILAHVLS
jgi:hypothetical protein